MNGPMGKIFLRLESRAVALLLALFGFAVVSLTHRQAKAQIDHETYLEVREASRSVIRRFPPEEWLYAFSGRSLKAMMIVMDRVGVPFVYLPFSSTAFRSDSMKLGEAEAQRIALEGFRPALQSERTRSARRILVIDYVISGESLKQAAELFGAAVDGSPEIATLGLAQSYSHVVDPPDYRLSLDDFPIYGRALFQHQDKRLSPNGDYGRSMMESGDAARDRAWLLGILRGEYEGHMDQDRELESLWIRRPRLGCPKAVIGR